MRIVTEIIMSKRKKSTKIYKRNIIKKTHMGKFYSKQVSLQPLWLRGTCVLLFKFYTKAICWRRLLLSPHHSIGLWLLLWIIIKSVMLLIYCIMRWIVFLVQWNTKYLYASCLYSVGLVLKMQNMFNFESILVNEKF